MRKKALFVLVVMCIFWGVNNSMAFAEGEINYFDKAFPQNGRLILNETEVEADVKPIFTSNYVLIPFRAVLESIGMSVNWISETGLHEIVFAENKYCFQTFFESGGEYYLSDMPHSFYQPYTYMMIIQEEAFVGQVNNYNWVPLDRIALWDLKLFEALYGRYPSYEEEKAFNPAVTYSLLLNERFFLNDKAMESLLEYFGYDLNVDTDSRLITITPNSGELLK